MYQSTADWEKSFPTAKTTNQQARKLMKRTTYVFAKKKFSIDIFNSDISYLYDYLVNGPRVVQLRE